ncbi:UNKNOWN [Stylonychia lemnae]|uniref:Uncharacterized protein n=1 Tax=Stylonychia lemnae TaxID=5949 RepID=A0A078B3Y4_STYLE|nr:UNKNOWN [Stylonychia lemnae]|eukprot:CDW89255.1 UNKNOWN [Stylonychia lemnae]
MIEQEERHDGRQANQNQQQRQNRELIRRVNDNQFERQNSNDRRNSQQQQERAGPQQPQLHAQQQQKKPKRKIPIGRFIKSDFVGKDKCSLVKHVDMRPTDKVQRKIFKYLCPICFRYFNEMLNCIACKNYVCLPCSRDLIKQELRRTKTLVPPPENICITCPHCMKSSTDDNPILFEDIDKTKPLKLYTDSPTGTIVLTHDIGIQEELKISMTKFNIGKDVQGLSFNKNSTQKKQGIMIKLPQSISGSNQFGHQANQQSCKSLVGQFVNKAHLEVLKSQDIEDQLYARKLVDILCFSPRNTKKLDHQILNHDQNYLYYNYQSIGKDLPAEKNKVEQFRMSMDSGQLRSTRKIQPQMNTMFKEHFWSLEFLQQLGQQNGRIGMQNSIKSRRNQQSFQSKTFEDLAQSQPKSIFNDDVIQQPITYMNGFPQRLMMSPGRHSNMLSVAKPPLHQNSAQRRNRLTVKNQDRSNLDIKDQQSNMKHSIGSQSNFQMEFYRNSVGGFNVVSSPKVIVLSNRDGESIFNSNSKTFNNRDDLDSSEEDDEDLERNHDDNDFQITQAKDNHFKPKSSPPRFQQAEGDKYKSPFKMINPNEISLSKYDQIIPTSQNPFQLLTNGVVKIGEYLQNQKQKPFQDSQEESKDYTNQDPEFIEFSDTYLQVSVNYVGEVNGPQTNEPLSQFKSGRDSLIYSDCDLNDEEDHLGASLTHRIQEGEDSINKEPPGSGDRMTDDKDPLTVSNGISMYGSDYMIPSKRGDQRPAKQNRTANNFIQYVQTQSNDNQFDLMFPLRNDIDHSKNKLLYGGGMNDEVFSEKQSQLSKDFTNQIAIKKDISDNEESYFDPYTAKINNHH